MSNKIKKRDIILILLLIISFIVMVVFKNMGNEFGAIITGVSIIFIIAMIDFCYQ